jgi:ABC-type methionine transport system permease subunit
VNAIATAAIFLIEFFFYQFLYQKFKANIALCVHDNRIYIICQAFIPSGVCSLPFIILLISLLLSLSLMTLPETGEPFYSNKWSESAALRALAVQSIFAFMHCITLNRTNYELNKIYSNK